MNTELTLPWVENIIGAFSLTQKLIAWNSYERQIEGIKKLSATKKIDTVIAPGGCTKYVQVPDVSWKNTFKANCTENYND